MKRVVPVAAAALAASVVLTGVTACSSSSNGGSGGGGGTSALDAALKNGGTLTYWSWSTAAKAKVAAFEAAYPQVKAKWANVASDGDEYLKLTNAINAGSGVPDAVQFEYTALPQFELAKDLVDLSKYGMGSVKSEFSSGAWSNVVSGKASTPFLRIPGRWRCCTTRRSSTSTALLFPRPGTSSQPMRRSCIRPTRTSI